MTTDPVLAVAVRAARRAAAVIGDAARDLSRLPTYSKQHGDIATAADGEAENAIVTALSSAFPDHAFLDEAGTVRPGRGAGSTHRWIVDPIDGTMNFLHGYPYYAISIALSQGFELTHAVVLDPIRDELFTAIRGKGAQLNGAPIRVSACTKLEDALLGTVFPARDSPVLKPYLPIFNALLGQCAGMRRAGACALDLAYLAAGRLDGFWVMSLKNWDVAAGALLVREAGGRVGDFHGGDDFLKSDEVIAATPGVFVSLRESIAAVR